MKLLYICTFMFKKDGEKTFGLPANADPFFQKYLDVFDEVRVLGDPMKSYLDMSALVDMTDKRISVRVLPTNTTPKDFKNDKEIKKILKEEISQAEAILIKPTTRKGMMAERIAKRLGKPFMIEMTGDIHNALLHQASAVRRLYAHFLFLQIKRNMRHCKFGLYVSRDYLQEKYPIEGEMCGCSDVIIEKADEAVLKRRIAKIEKLHAADRVDMALIGFYQGLMKGVDTAIRALAQLPEKYHLNILGNGTEENRQRWIKYGEERGVFNRIHFPKPLPSSHEVLQWLDTQDFFVLPTLSEGLCRCVVEAISRGCPSFCTNITTMPELLPSDCLINVGDDKKLASLISDAYNNPDKMKEMATENFNHARDYDFDVLRERRNAFLGRFREYCEKFN